MQVCVDDFVRLTSQYEYGINGHQKQGESHCLINLPYVTIMRCEMEGWGKFCPY